MASIATAMLHRVSVAGGVKLPCAEYGTGSGLPVLLLHSYTDTRPSFELLLPHLPRALRLIVPTQRGDGDTGRPLSSYTSVEFAADALAVLDALGVRQTIVVGHSMGNQIALRLAREHPDRVSGLVLIGGFASLAEKHAVQAVGNEAIAGLVDLVDPAFVTESQHSTVARAVPEALLDPVVRENPTLPAGAWRQALAAMAQEPLIDDVPRVTAPTLLLWGDRDAIVSHDQQEVLAATLPDVRLEVLPGTGHAPHREDPERTAAAVIRFVHEVVARSVLPGNHMPFRNAA